MEITIKCPDDARIVGAWAVGGVFPQYGVQTMVKAEDGAEINLEDPREQDDEEE